MPRSPFPRLASLWRAGRLTVWADVLLVVFLTVAAVALTSEHADAPGPPEMIFWPGPHDAAGSMLFVGEQQPSTPAVLGMNLLVTVPLLARRRWPLLCFAVQFTALLAIDIDGNLANLAAVLIGAYSLVIHTRSVALSMGALLTTCAIVVANDAETWPSLPGWAGVFVLLMPIGLLGVAIRAARSRAVASEQRAQAVEREQRAATRLAVAEERARIARELHDVVSHHVSVMTIQAGAAGKVLDAHPAMAREALSAVEASGRETMAELRHLLGVLAPDPGDDLLRPQPGLDQLETLVANVRKAGQPVTLVDNLRRAGRPAPVGSAPEPSRPKSAVGSAPEPDRPESAIDSVPELGRPEPALDDVTREQLPHGLDLAAYRVVQEALTNALRHAPGAQTEVTVSVEPSGAGKDLVVAVVNDAPPPHARPAAGSATGSGSGLLGLAERLRLYDGTLETRRRVGGGFRVYARMPLPVPARPEPEGAAS